MSRSLQVTFSGVPIDQVRNAAEELSLKCKAAGYGSLPMSDADAAT